MARLIYVDGVARAVKGEGRELHGFLDLHVGDLDSPRIHAVHGVPASWWRDERDRSAVLTGGHRYSKEAPRHD